MYVGPDAFLNKCYIQIRLIPIPISFLPSFRRPATSYAFYSMIPRKELLTWYSR